MKDVSKPHQCSCDSLEYKLGWQLSDLMICYRLQFPKKCSSNYFIMPMFAIGLIYKDVYFVPMNTFVHLLTLLWIIPSGFHSRLSTPSTPDPQRKIIIHPLGKTNNSNKNKINLMGNFHYYYKINPRRLYYTVERQQLEKKKPSSFKMCSSKHKWFVFRWMYSSVWSIRLKHYRIYSGSWPYTELKFNTNILKWILK